MKCLKSSKTVRRLDLSLKSLSLNLGAERGLGAPCSILLRRAGKSAVCKVKFARPAAFCLSCALKFMIRTVFCVAVFVIPKIYPPRAYFVLLRLNSQPGKTRSKFKVRNLKPKTNSALPKRRNLPIYLAAAKSQPAHFRILIALNLAANLLKFTSPAQKSL